jgi:hypothetical protein
MRNAHFSRFLAEVGGRFYLRKISAIIFRFTVIIQNMQKRRAQGAAIHSS